MASVKVENVLVEKVVTTLVDDERIVLNMSREEAAALRGLLGALTLPTNIENADILQELRSSLKEVIGWVGKVSFTEGAVRVSKVDPDFTWLDV